MKPRAIKGPVASSHLYPGAPADKLLWLHRNDTDALELAAAPSPTAGVIGQDHPLPGDGMLPYDFIDLTLSSSACDLECR